MFQSMFSLIRREFMLAGRNKAEILNPLVFLLMVIALFPLAVGPEPNLLSRIAPGIVWVAVLLAAMLGIERLFRDDYQDGTLELLVLSPQPLGFLALAKILSHWLLSCLPILLLSPVFALFLHMDGSSYWALVSTLLVGTPLISAVGAIGAALTVSLQRSGVLVSILILPLFIPVLIFATAAIDAASMALPYNGQLAIMAALTITSLALSPLAISAALKLSVN